MLKNTSFTSLRNALPYLKEGYKEHCIDGKQCKVTTCYVHNLLLNMGHHIDTENKFMIFGHAILLENLDESKNVFRKD